jgi:hypothetical protein
MDSEQERLVEHQIELASRAASYIKGRDHGGASAAACRKPERQAVPVIAAPQNPDEGLPALGASRTSLGAGLGVLA